MLTLAHISDLHCGPHFRPQVAEALLRSVAEAQPDIVVASGDFTHRARRAQYNQARDFLARLPAVPTVVVPGNHDVPLYRVRERLFSPYDLYREFIRDERDWTLVHERAVIVALNTTSPLRKITNGRIVLRQLDFCRQAFAAAPAGAVRIVVAHHPFARSRDYEGGEVMWGLGRALKTLAELRVELVLGGHHHRAFVTDSRDVYAGEPDERPVLIVQAGTATTSRGRARERGRNSFNVLRIDESTIQVEVRLYPPASDAFAAVAWHKFPRVGGK